MAATATGTEEEERRTTLLRGGAGTGTVDTASTSFSSSSSSSSASASERLLTHHTAGGGGGGVRDDVDSLLREAERLASVDRVLDARAAVDSVESIVSGGGGEGGGGGLESASIHLNPSQRKLVDSIVSESDRVRFMLDDLRRDDGWTLCQNGRRGGMTVHYKNEEGSPIHAVKTRTVLDGFTAEDYVNLASLFVETDLMPRWFPGGVLKSCDVLASHSVYRQCLQMQMSFGRFSPLSDRDAVVEGRGYFLPDRNAALVLSRSIDESDLCDIPPPAKGIVRVDTFSAFYVELLPGDRVLLRFIAHDDLKLKYVPPVVLNYLSQGHMPSQIVQAIVGAVRNCRGSEWERRVRSKPEVYGDILRRAYGGGDGGGGEEEEERGSGRAQAKKNLEKEHLLSEEEASSRRRGAPAASASRPNGILPPPDWTPRSLACTVLAVVATVPLSRFGTRLSIALSVALPWSFFLALMGAATVGAGWLLCWIRGARLREERESRARARARWSENGRRRRRRKKKDDNVEEDSTLRRSPSVAATAAKLVLSAGVRGVSSEGETRVPSSPVSDSIGGKRKRGGRVGSVRRSISKAMRRSFLGKKKHKRRYHASD